MKPGAAFRTVPRETISFALAEHEKLASGQKYIRGLFSGGTLCYEAQVILQPVLGDVFSNAPIKPENSIPGDDSKKHTFIDMGAEEFVEGRVHPMIDFTLRNLRILKEARDPETALIFIDVELGYGSNDDPAGQLVPTIQKAKSFAEEAGRHLPVVASVVGTEGDSQDLARQEAALSGAGVLIMPSNAQAARVSALIACGREIEGKIRGLE
jgi:FdrA protein